MEKKKSLLCKSVFIALACCLCVMCFSGIKAEAAMKKSAANVLKLYKQGKYKKAIKMAKKLPQNANEKCVKNMSAKMKKAYLKKVKSFKTSGKSYILSYFLTDINNDKKAELIIKYMKGTDIKTVVYTYKKGKAAKVGSINVSHPTFYAYPNKNGLLVKNSYTENEEVYLITMKNMKLKKKLIGSRYVGVGEYISLPYALDYHKNGSMIDYSALK